MNLPRPFLAPGLALALVASAAAQVGPRTADSVEYTRDSGARSNDTAETQVVISFPVHFDGAPWLRLYFEEVELAGGALAGDGAILRLTAWEDGEVQELDERQVRQWQLSSGYFNGDTVQVEVLARPGTGPSRVKLRSVDIGLPGIDPTASQCGPVDDRERSNDPRAGRLLPIGCTSWLIDDCANCLLTAGHCTGNVSVVEFNVPPSDPDGSLNHPPLSDQYAVDLTSLQSNGGQGVGDDWAYFGCFANGQTGLTAAEAQGAVYTLGAPPGSLPGNDIRITGYGTDSTPPERNQVQQTHVGPLADVSGTQIGYVTDTTGGNSGSPVIWEQNGTAVGIHTHGGCSTDGTGNNWGTKSNHPDLQAALASPLGICRALGLSTPGLPETVAPDTRTTLQLQVDGDAVPNSARLHYRFDGGTYQVIAMNALGGGLHEATLPGAACDDAPELFFSAQHATCGTLTLPANAPAEVFDLDVGVAVTAFEDDFESDTGWTDEVLGATSGQWQRGVPVNDAGWAYDPLDDGDGSGSCYLTQNQLGNTDVDDGSVRLTSPAIDMSAGGMGVRYLYFLNLTNESGVDRLLVEMSDSGPGGPWTVIATHTTSGGLAWREQEFSEADLIAAGLTPGSNMRLRFTANDSDPQSINESGVDGVRVFRVDCDDDGIGTAYCTPAVDNSTGQPGRIRAFGSLAAGDNDLTLLADQLPPDKLIYHINGLTQTFLPNPGGSQGNLCISGAGRHRTQAALSTPGGTYSVDIDLTDVPRPGGPDVAVQPGETWYWQGWYRDNNPGQTSNFTDGVCVQFN